MRGHDDGRVRASGRLQPLLARTTRGLTDLSLRPPVVDNGAVRRALAALLVLVVFAASGCGESRYKYEEVSEVNLFFRVPRQWTIFDETETARQADDVRSGTYTVRRLVLDSSQAASSAHIDDLNASDIVGELDVQGLNGTYADNTSLSDIRTTLAGFGFDPASPPDSVLMSGGYQVLRTVPLALADGSQGTYVAYAAALDPDGQAGPAPVVVRQLINVSFINPVGRTAYLLRFHCRADCSEKEIKDAIGVVNSLIIHRD